jgi:hypothetical protein
MRPTELRATGAFVVAAGILGAMCLARGTAGLEASKPAAYLDAGSSAIGAIPYRSAGWIGADVEAQAPAVQLLRPNKLLQRRYIEDSGGEGFSLLVVHCSDARDMQGHYPPICYPAHGWILTSTEIADFAMGAISTPCRVYHLSRVKDGVPQEMTILNFFVVPSQTEALAADMKALDRASASLSRSGMGAAQLQLIVAGSVPSAEMVELMERIVPSLEPAVWTIVNGSAGND